MKKLTCITMLFCLTQLANAQEEMTTAFKAYSNYDFVPGDEILFEDDFRAGQDGEFAEHWKLMGGQGVVNTKGDDRFFSITKYYTALTPLIKAKSYLPENFTIEFDTWLDAKYDGNPGIMIAFNNGDDALAVLNTAANEVDFSFPGGRLTGELPKALADNGAYYNKWHHFAIAVKGKQVKIYCDQYRVLVAPDAAFKAATVVVKGDASEGMNMLFKNFRLAEGGNFNVVGKKFTDPKLITHGITFDYNKVTIKAESMGTLNMVVQIMKDNPEIQFEVGGYTDSDGDDAFNLKLSQQRADAVKTQLVSLGVDAARLTAKGYGKTKPVSDNTTPEGKANNRRVEFVKMNK